MKKLGLALGLGILLVIGLAIGTAGQMGETNHAYAKGRIVLDPRLLTQAQGIETLFIIASGPDRPMPLGALRKVLGSANIKADLYEFVLTKDNMQLMGGGMGGGGPGPDLPETFKLKARLDRDGVAGPDQPGDLVGEIAVVRRGQDDLELRIDRAIP